MSGDDSSATAMSTIANANATIAQLDAQGLARDAAAEAATLEKWVQALALELSMVKRFGGVGLIFAVAAITLTAF